MEVRAGLPEEARAAQSQGIGDIDPGKFGYFAKGIDDGQLQISSHGRLEGCLHFREQQ